MPRKHDDPAESKRFIETARKIEADERSEAFERAFKRVVPPKKRPKRKSRR